ncbi:MAG: biopolymer transporter ExbD [Roseinatronobacter sp.]|nr:biopolymer transporter ExbD [Roseinatronobacter sp.]
MTSLIDVIFLLLLFFMLSSTFARQGELPLDVALGGAETPLETPPAFVQLRAEGLRLDGRDITPEALREDLAMRGEGVVLLSIDDGAQAQPLAEILHAVQGLGGWRLAVLRAAS